MNSIASTLPGAAGAGKVARIVALACAALLAFEATLQIRSQMNTGQSLVTLLENGTSYVTDPATGLRILRPNSVFAGERVTLRSNSLGLRSPEIPAARAPGSWRLAVIGASTVMGLYDSDTDTTFPARLEQDLRRRFPQRRIDVVNAGIMGYTLADQRRMLETKVASLHPDLVIVYSGFNDFVGYCGDAELSVRHAHRQGLPLVEMPPWLFTVDNIRKKTVFLRTTLIRQATMKDPADLDLRPYHARLEALAERARQLHLPLLFATNARAYRREQPLEQQLLLSTSARHYNRCFDLDGLHVLYDRHNAEIRAVAAARGIPLVPLDTLVPGGPRYFVDAQHFSAAGATLVGRTLADFVVGNKLLPE